MRLDDAVTWFLGSWPYEGPRVPTADTVRDYSASLKWLVGFALRTKRPFVADLDDSLLRAAIKEILEGHTARSPLYKGGEGSARMLVCAARKLARWLLAQGLPVATLTVRGPKAPERIQPRLRPEEFRELEQAILRQLVEGEHTHPRVTVARDLALLYLLADTGLRAAEVCAMNVDDVLFDRGAIVVRHGKGNKERSLSIVDVSDPRGGDTIRLLLEWLRVRQDIPGIGDEPALWVSVHRGRRLAKQVLRRILGRHCRAAGLDGNRPPHAFRRATFTERYRADPASVNVLAARMGWSPKSHHMVSVYTRGAELEFAAEVALPSMASLWHDGTKVPFDAEPRRPILLRGAGSGGRKATVDPRQPYTGDGDQTASVNSRRSQRHSR